MITTTSKKLTVNVSPAVSCFRLVHDGKKVLSLFESAGSTHTINTLFCGTAEECADYEERELEKTSEADPETGVGLAVDLVGHRDQREVAAQQGDQLTDDQQAEIAALAQRAPVHEQARHPHRLGD